MSECVWGTRKAESVLRGAVRVSEFVSVFGAPGKAWVRRKRMK